MPTRELHLPTRELLSANTRASSANTRASSANTRASSANTRLRLPTRGLNMPTRQRPSGWSCFGASDAPPLRASFKQHIATIMLCAWLPIHTQAGSNLARDTLTGCGKRSPFMPFTAHPHTSKNKPSFSLRCVFALTALNYLLRHLQQGKKQDGPRECENNGERKPVASSPLRLTCKLADTEAKTKRCA